MMNHIARALNAAADPQCASCDGEGWIDVTYSSRPDTDERVACACVERTLDDEPDDAPTCDPRPFLRHLGLAFAWCRHTNRRGDERQISRLMARHSAAALEQMLA